MKNIINSLQEKGLEHGIQIPSDLIPGKIKRFSDGSSKKNKNCWAVFFENSNGSAGGAFGDWSKDTKANWFYSPDGKPLTKNEEQEFSKKITKQIEKEQQERQKNWENIAQKAQSIWGNSRPAMKNHAYLMKKKIYTDELRQKNGNILVPIYNESEKIMSLQTISPDGQKKFLPGGKIAGNFFVIGDIKESSCLIICEGFATGATINSATGHPVVVAFNASNLEAVSKIVRKKHPNKLIILAADNDNKTEEKTGQNPGIECATKAATSVNGIVCISPVNTDFNDLYCGFENNMEATEAVKKAFNNLTQGIVWEDPIPFEGEHLPEVDISIFPSAIGDMILGVSIETETPRELATGLALSTVATACHGKIQTQVKENYVEPLNLYTMTALDPGNRKSAVLTKMIKPILYFEKICAASKKSQIEDAKIQRSLEEAKLKKLKSLYASSNDPKKAKQYQAEYIALEKNLTKIPKKPQIVCQDVTTEKLAMLMADNKERIANFSAEGGIFEILGGKYSNNSPNMDLYLQAHSGDTHKVDRAGRDQVVLHCPCLSIGFSPQPDILKGVISNPVFRSRGLSARFLYFLPKSLLGYRKGDTEAVPQNVTDKYHDIITTLLEIRPKKDQYGAEIPYIIHLSEDAYNEHFEFRQHVETQLRPAGDYENLRDWAGKLPGAAARIAGILHCVENPHDPWKTLVSLETMEKAIEIAAVYAKHAEKVFNSPEADEDVKNAGKIIQWLKNEYIQRFSQRDCFEKFKGTVKKVSNLEPVLALLIKNNYIQKHVTEHSKVGRPSEEFDVNLNILGVK